MGPNECKYCGCSEIRSETDSAIHFRCFSNYRHDGDEWNIATNCAARCAVQLVELRERVQRAVEVLEGGDRIMMMLDEDDEEVSFVVPATDVDRSIGILGGEEDEQAD